MSEKGEIEHMITESNAHSTFHNGLRTNEKNNIYADTKILYPYKDINKLPKSKKNISNFFEGKSKEIKNQAKKHFEVKDNLMFNDNYVENNKSFRMQKRRTFASFNQLQQSNNYLDEPRSQRKSNAFQRKIKDNYYVNPMEILNKEQTKEMNNSFINKIKNKSKAVGDYMGSNNLRKTFGSYNNRNEPLDKITNNNSSTLTNAIKDNQKQPYFGRRRFNQYIVEGKQVAYV